MEILGINNDYKGTSKKVYAIPIVKGRKKMLRNEGV